MKLLLNTASTHVGGSVQVALSIVNELRYIPDNDYFVFLSPTLTKMVDAETFPKNFHFFSFTERPAERVASLHPMSVRFRKIEAQISPDCVFTTSGPAYWRPKAVHLMGYNLPHYVYPESPYWRKVSLAERIRVRLKGFIIRALFRREGDAYVVQTEDVRDRVRKILGGKEVFTISNTCSRFFFEEGVWPKKLPERKEGEVRLLTISAYYKHKNLDVIPKVIERLRSRKSGHRIRFILTIQKHEYEELFNGDVSKFVSTVGSVNPKECPGIYEECDFLFLPTLMECFSAAYPEAMAMGKPILTSDLGFARSVCGDAAVYFDPLNEEDIAKKIIELVNDPVRQDELRAAGRERLRGFPTARERAERIIGLCEDLVAERRRR